MILLKGCAQGLVISWNVHSGFAVLPSWVEARAPAATQLGRDELAAKSGCLLNRKASSSR